MTIKTGAKSGNGKCAAAFEQGSTWNTAVAVGSGDGLRFTSEAIRGGAAPLERATVGAPWGDKRDVGAQLHRGVISGDLFLGSNVGKFLSYVFGTSGSPTQTPPSTGTTYLHVADIANSLTKFFTLCVARRAQASDSVKWEEYASAMIRRLTIRGSGNGRLTWEAEIIGSALSLDSSTNTTTETDAVTVPDVLAAARFTDGTFRINAASGSSLGSGDKEKIASFELTIERPLSEDFLADGTGAVAQPGEQDVCMARLAVELRSYDETTYRTAYAAGTEYKADLKFLATGAAPSGGSDPYIEFQFPRLVVRANPDANVAGRARIAHRIEFDALVAASAPSGMSGVTQPVRMNVLDADSGAYLS